MQKYSCVQSSELRQQRRVCCLCWAWWWCSSVYSRRPLLALAVIRRRIQKIINKIEVLFLWNIWRQCRQWCAYVCLYHCMFDAGAAAKCCWDCSVAWIDYKRPPPPAATTPTGLAACKIHFCCRCCGYTTPVSGTEQYRFSFFVTTVAEWKY